MCCAEELQRTGGGCGIGVEITEEVRRQIDAAVTDEELNEDEYISAEDGLIYCRVCGTRRRTVVPKFGKDGYTVLPCICLCEQQEEQRRDERRAQRERIQRIERLRKRGLRDEFIREFTFTNDNGRNPMMKKARAYVEHWDDVYRNNVGLLLFGDVGTGKSFFAGCIANALIDRDVPVMMTNFPSILNHLTGAYGEERTAFIEGLNDYDLLIIDDLGVERGTGFALEQMFEVIDNRFRSRKPMIITTNLTLYEMRNPPDLAYARIYDRILERCAPILFEGENFRKQKAEENKNMARVIMAAGGR